MRTLRAIAPSAGTFNRLGKAGQDNLATPHGASLRGAKFATLSASRSLAYTFNRPTDAREANHARREESPCRLAEARADSRVRRLLHR
jgi:hypothetical protein